MGATSIIHSLVKPQKNKGTILLKYFCIDFIKLDLICQRGLGMDTMKRTSDIKTPSGRQRKSA